MTSNRKAIRDAYDIYKRAATLNQAEQEAAIKLLASADLWSKAQIAKIVRVPAFKLKGLVDKSDHTGGRFNPEALDLILEAIALKDQGEVNVFLTAAILDRGVSSYMLGKLIGVPVPTVKYHALRAKALAA